MQSSLSSLQCSVCFNDYDLSIHLPKVLPNCGHTVCSKCLSDLLGNTEPKCPMDQKLICKNSSPTQRNIENFPLNFSLRHLIEENLEWDLCKEHGERLKLVCFTEKKKLCPYCLFYEDHKTHIVKEFSALKLIVDKKKADMEAALKNLNNYQSDINNALEDARTNLQDIVNERFAELVFIIRNKKLEFSMEIDSFFEQEKIRASHFLGESSMLRTSIMDKILYYMSPISKQDLSSFLEPDNTELISKLDSVNLKNLINKLNERLSAASTSFDRSLLSQIELFNCYKIPGESFIKDMDSLYSENQGERMLIEFENSSPLLVAQSSFEIQKRPDCIEIIASHKRLKGLLIDAEELRNGNEVRVALKKFAFNDDDLNTLRYIWAKLDQRQCVRFIAEYQDIFPEEKLLHLFSIIFFKAEFLHEVEINLMKSNLTTGTLLILFKRILSKIANLKKLKIDLKGSNISNRAVKALALDVFPYLKELEALSLHLAETNVSEEAIITVFNNIPNVINLLIGLGGTNTTDTSLEIFAKDKLPLLKNLKELELGVWSTKVTDKSVSRLLMNFPEVRALKLGFRNTQITDKCLEEFVKVKVPNMRGLEDVEIIFDGTEVSSEMKLQFWEVVKPYIK